MGCATAASRNGDDFDVGLFFQEFGDELDSILARHQNIGNNQINLVFEIWLDGALVIELVDPAPIAEGTLRFVTGHIRPADFMDIRVYGSVDISEGWLPVLGEVDYTQREVKITAASSTDSSMPFIFDDRTFTFNALLGEDKYSKVGCEFRVTDNESYYKVMLQQEYSTVVAGDWAWVAKLDKYLSGEYTSTLDSADVTAIIAPVVSAGYTTAFRIDAVAGMFRVFLDGVQVLGAEDADPVEAGALRLVTGRVAPVEISDVHIKETSHVEKVWIKVDPAYYTQEFTRVAPKDLITGDDYRQKIKQAGYRF